ncbi:MAG: M3 family oligoendopeptidase [Hydrogenibacillus schlegelii]|nr:M3 family oligoendopeptidase [Hydrogenibacillus schlegelii]
MRWDLEGLFPGGSRGEAFVAFLDALEGKIAWAREAFDAPLPEPGEERAGALWTRFDQLGMLFGHLREAGAFVSCLTAQDVHDEAAKRHGARLSRLSAEVGKLSLALDAALAEADAATWQALLRRAEGAMLREVLEERRMLARKRMPEPLEKLQADLAVDGYHGWGEMYHAFVGTLSVEVARRPGEAPERLSVGQAANLLVHPERAVREAAFSAYEATWKGASPLGAEILNHLAGYRLTLYRHRGYADVLEEPLLLNRMTRETLEAMWDAVVRKRTPLVRYLEAKAKRLGLSRLAWFDVDAPLPARKATIPFDEGAAIIVEQFRRFSEELAELAEQAFRERWIEVEDRPGKRPGGFCTSFPLKRQSRIFMTYAGTPDNVSTLAHELGHAYHQRVVDDLPFHLQRYAMNVAETASTFAEAIVTDALIEQATGAERLALLDDRLSRAVAFLMNIHARFLFETRFYAERAKRRLSPDELDALMLEAQKEAYEDALAVYHPPFWLSKLHFYLTSVPFYNFPYTFGYLFSTALYAEARAEGPSFHRRYRALLRDTGRLPVERLAREHLGVDLTRPEFWERAVEAAVADVEAFVREADVLPAEGER